MNTFKDHEINHKFPRTFGIDLSFSDNGNHYVSVYEGSFPRKAILDITTWKGLTAGALHYYGTLKISSLKCRNLKNGQIDYPKANAPKESKGLRIELTRPLGKKDLLLDRGQRFKGAKLGEKIKNFDSAAQVEAAAINFFRKYFLKGWKLVKVKPVKNMSFGGLTVTNDEIILCAHHLAI